jgi:hypothetical protein
VHSPEKPLKWSHVSFFNGQALSIEELGLGSNKSEGN